MKIAVMQPYFFPYYGYFQLVHAVDKFVFYDDVNFINRGWIHRNKIQVNQKPTYFGLKLSKASQNKKINEITLFKEPKWRKKLIKKIQFSYKNAPYFENAFALCQKVINDPTDNLADMTKQSVIEVSDYLSLDTGFINSSSRFDNQHLKGTNRILDICKQLKAETYINPPGGSHLYDTNDFKKEGIELRILHPEKIHYPQFTPEFVPGLSILDMLFFNNKNQVKKYLSNFKLS